MKNRRFIKLLMVLVTVGIFSPARAILVGPPVIYLSGDRGETLRQKITIANNVQKSPLNVSFTSFIMGEEVENIRDTSAISNFDCRVWLQLPEKVTKSFDLVVRIPEATRSGVYRTKLYFSTPRPKGGKGIGFALRVGLYIFIEVGRPKKDLRIALMRYEQPYLYIHFRNDSRALIHELDINVVGIKRVPWNHVVLPGHTRIAKIPLNVEDLKGEKISVIVDFGGSFDLSGTLRLKP